MLADSSQRFNTSRPINCRAAGNPGMPDSDSRHVNLLARSGKESARCGKSPLAPAVLAGISRLRFSLNRGQIGVYHWILCGDDHTLVEVD